MLEMGCELHVFFVVDGAVDDDRFILLEGLSQSRQEVFCFFDAVADGVEAFGQFYEVRIGEVDTFVMAVLHVLFPFDEAVAAVIEDEGYEVRSQAVSRFKFLDVHQEAGIAGDGQHFFVGVDEFC